MGEETAKGTDPENGASGTEPKKDEKKKDEKKVVELVRDR